MESLHFCGGDYLKLLRGDTEVVFQKKKKKNHPLDMFALSIFL